MTFAPFSGLSVVCHKNNRTAAEGAQSLMFFLDGERSCYYQTPTPSESSGSLSMHPRLKSLFPSKVVRATWAVERTRSRDTKWHVQMLRHLPLASKNHGISSEGHEQTWSRSQNGGDAAK